MYAKLHANESNNFHSDWTEQYQSQAHNCEHANGNKHETCHTYWTVISILWQSDRSKQEHMLFIVRHGSCCSNIISCWPPRQEEEIYRISPTSGSTTHFLARSWTWPRSGDPAVPEEYLEHCLTSTYTQSSPSSHELQYTLRPAQLLGVQPPGDKNVTATSGPVREVDGRGWRGEPGSVGAGWGGYGRFSLSGGKKGGREERKKHNNRWKDEMWRGKNVTSGGIFLKPMRTELFTFVVQRSDFASGQVSPDLEKQLSLFFPP